MEFPKLQPYIYPSVFYGKYFVPDSTKPQNVYVQFPIEWLVLEMNYPKKRALLVSKYAIDWEGFADCPILSSGFETSWEQSYLRTWLNGDFYNECFSSEERDNICTTYLKPSNENAKGTIDKVFLLSTDDVHKYFTTKDSAIAREPMFINIANGTKEHPLEIECNPIMWWTRTTGTYASDVICVGEDGELYEMDSNCEEIGVRPAMWINL